MQAVSGEALRRALFAPRAVALVGASANPDKTTGRPLRYLLRHGYAGQIHPVNPNRSEIGGLRAYPDLLAVPDGVDHAFLMCGRDEVLPAIEACGARGIPCATILAGGFAETGPEGAALQARVAAAARRAGVRLLGPNSIGVIDTAGFACSANAVLEAERLLPGRYGVVSQSGSMIGGLVSQGAARGIGFSTLVSIGNEIDLTLGEVAGLMLRDDRCDAVLLFLEAIKDRATLADCAARAQDAGKALIAYKLGRSQVGRDLAATHTGALAGDDRIADAVLHHLGIARVTMFDSLIESAPLFRGPDGRCRPSPGRRVAIVSTTGGGGAVLADCLGALGLDLAPAPAAVRSLMRQAGISDGSGRLIDLTLAGTHPAVVQGVIAALMADAAIDAVAMVIGSSAEYRPDMAVAPLLSWQGAPKPLAVYTVPAAAASQRHLVEAGLAVFRSPEACAESLRARLAWRPPATDRALAPSEDAAAARVAAMIASGALSSPDEAVARSVLDALGIAGPPGEIVTSAAAAAAAFDRLGGPVAAKIVSPDIAHKTDIGGVVLGIDTPAAAAEAHDRLTDLARKAHPEARLRGVLVQRMETGVAEAILGFRRDPALGPVVLLGTGGVLAELFEDTALRVAPVDLPTAREMVAGVRGLARARGYRGAPPGDTEALARAVVALSLLAHCPAIAEAEINPLLVRPEGQGVSALDALVVAAQP